MQDFKKQLDVEVNFSWKNEMYVAEKNLAIRVKILEQTGNVECTMRTKRNYSKIQKKIKQMWEDG